MVCFVNISSHNVVLKRDDLAALILYFSIALYVDPDLSVFVEGLQISSSQFKGTSLAWMAGSSTNKIITYGVKVLPGKDSLDIAGGGSTLLAHI